MDNEVGEQSWLEAIARALPDPVFVVDEAGMYLEAFGGRDRGLYDAGAFLRGKNLRDVLPAATAELFLKEVRRCLETGSLVVVEYELSSQQVAGTTADGPSGTQSFEGRLYPVKRPGPGPRSVVWVALNTTERRRQEAELRKAQSEVRSLEGLLPICASCKRIRDAQGRWHQVERYIARHADVTFSHGLCPDCLARLYPDDSP